MILPRFIDSTAKKSGQRLDNVNQTYIVLASGKPVLKMTVNCSSTRYIKILPVKEVPFNRNKAILSSLKSLFGNLASGSEFRSSLDEFSSCGHKTSSLTRLNEMRPELIRNG